MSNPIDPTGSAKIATPPRVSAVKPAQSTPDSNSASATTSSANEDTVHLTGDAVQIHQLAASVGKTPAFDAKKVSDIKQQISSGKYVVDSRATAGKMLALDSGLGAY
jgi:flagellar biosynthesis anti-sigma factor FlgM